MSSSEQLWETLFELAPIKRPKPPSTLYDVIVDTADLETVKRYVAGGHALSQRFAGGHSVALAAKYGNLEFVRYFVENSSDRESVPGLLAKAVERVSESEGNDLESARAILVYLLAQPFAQSQLSSAYTASAFASQYSTAISIIDAGLADDEIRAGEKGRTTRLSAHLISLGQPAFAALLSGEPVDHEELLHAEEADRRQNAELRSILGDAVPFAGQQVLEGPAFAKRYRSLLDDVEAGKWHGALTSRDRRFGRSVIEFAAANGFVEVVRLILSIGPMPPKDARIANVAAAVAAATWGHLDVLEALHEADVEIEATPSNDDSPLSEACRYGHTDVVRYLLNAGADPRSGDGSGHNLTLFDIAGGEQRNEIIAALEAA